MMGTFITVSGQILITYHEQQDEQHKSQLLVIILIFLSQKQRLVLSIDVQGLNVYDLLDVSERHECPAVNIKEARKEIKKNSGNKQEDGWK